MENWKYIVYETTNLINNKIYIGVHKTVDPNVFDGYIGNGIYVTQPYTYQYAKTHFQCAVKKYGPKNFRRKVLAVFNTEQEAYALEEDLVNETFLARDDVYNMVLGGAGGYYISNRIKVYQYSENGEYLNEYESMADAALQMKCADYTLISYAVRKKFKAKGFFWSTDKVDKLDLSNYNLGLNHSIQNYCYLKTGEFYKAYKTLAEASRDIRSCSGTIRNACLLGNCVQNKYYFSFIKADSYDKARKLYIETRPVYKYNSETGEFIEGYESQLEAESMNPKSNITKSIKLKQPDENNFIWGIEKLKIYGQKENKNKKRKVGKYDLSGNLVQIYDSATKAANENGTSVWKVLAGTNNTHKQHVYKYLE